MYINTMCEINYDDDDAPETDVKKCTFSLSPAEA